MTDRPSLDVGTEALRALAVALEYGYSPAAAYEAVLAEVADLDAAQGRQALAAMAAFVAEYAVGCSFAPAGRQPALLEQQVRWARCRLAGEGSAE